MKPTGWRGSQPSAWERSPTSMKPMTSSPASATKTGIPRTLHTDSLAARGSWRGLRGGTRCWLRKSSRSSSGGGVHPSSWCPYGPKKAIADSRGVSFIEVEESAKPFAATDGTRIVGRIGRWKGNDIAKALVIPFGVIVRDEFPNRSSQMTLAERNEVTQAFLLDRTNESFREPVGKTYQLLGMRTLRRKLSG
jgi:hypothetical protein